MALHMELLQMVDVGGQKPALGFSMQETRRNDSSNARLATSLVTAMRLHSCMLMGAFACALR